MKRQRGRLRHLVHPDLRNQAHSASQLVNDGADTAPSKRIMNAYPQYAKTIDSPLVIAEAGLDAIRSTCPHADDWLRELEARTDVTIGYEVPGEYCTFE
jgi:hypothetical protein